MNNTVAVILAAGAGKRFWPFVTDKSLFPFLEEPILLHNLKHLASAGFSRAVIVTNPVNDGLIRSWEVSGLRLRTVVQKEPIGMGAALLTVQKEVGDNPMLIINAEDVVDDGLYALLAKETKKSHAFVVGRTTPDYFDGGYLMLSGNRLTGILEKPGAGKEPSPYVNLVFHFFPKGNDFFSVITSTSSARDDIYEKALSYYCQKTDVSVVPYAGNWLPLKYPWHVLPIMKYFLAKYLIPKQGKHVDIHHNVSIVGPVAIGDNVKIFENTKIVGPTYIGNDTIIGSNNIIRESVIGTNGVTGFNTDMARSYIGDNCWFHTNYVGDSVLEGNVSMGSGSVLANLRLDEGEIASQVGGTRVATHRTKLGAMIGKNVRIGVNASIMPGVKIGTNSFVGAGVVLDGDLDEGSFCVAKPGYTVVKNTKHIPSKGRGAFKAKLS